MHINRQFYKCASSAIVAHFQLQLHGNTYMFVSLVLE